MNFHTTVGIISAIAFALPALIILFCRLYTNISLVALTIYFLMGFTFTLMAENIIAVPTEVRKSIGVISNYLDVPLILTSLLMFCTEKWKRKVLLSTLLLFFVYELMILFGFQLQPLSSKYIMGPGIILVVLFSLYFFIVNIKSTIIQGKGMGKTLMTASTLFAYGCYTLVYIFHYIQRASNKSDVFIIYYISSIIFALLMSAGLLHIQKRLKEIKEVQTARKELSIFFNHNS